MSEQSSKRSVCVAAAAGIAACSLAGMTEEVQATPVWQSGASSSLGTYHFDPLKAGNDEPDQPIVPIDFNEDGVAEFALYFYGGWEIVGSERFSDVFSPGVFHFVSNRGPEFDVIFPRNPKSISVFDIARLIEERGPDSFGPAFPIRETSLDEVHSNAIAFAQDPSVGDEYFPASLLGSGFDERGYWSGLFEDEAGTQYVGYVDVSVGPGNLDPVTIHDAGFAQIPEPSSLALLAIGGLMIARRRRG